MEIPTVKVGDKLIQLIADAYELRIPVLLIGNHGIGKSEVLAQAAAALGISYHVLDLSIMQPPDLVGIPTVEAGVTHFARPAFLPMGGAGLMAFEELNR
ncbi:MAG: AAA family ATPase, partial [Planctomycetota bacterium]